MKNYYLLFLLLTSLSSFVKAQKSSEISVGVGDGSLYEMMFSFEKLVFDIIPQSVVFEHNFREDVNVDTPYIFVDYRYQVSNRLTVGGQVGYFAYSGTTTETTKQGTIYEIYDIDRSVFTIMPTLDYSYLKRNKFNFYGSFKFGVGITSSEVKGRLDHLKDGEESNVMAVYQINPIGISYGERVKVFAEGGIGISVVNAGLRFKF